MLKIIIDMLISHSHKLIFIHIQKTGGSTISEILSKNFPDICQFKAKHDFAIQGTGELCEWKDYYKFAFVRNPWDRLVSWYTMINSAKHIRWHQTLTNPIKKSITGS